jgi:hypothetical protein
LYEERQISPLRALVNPTLHFVQDGAPRVVALRYEDEQQISPLRACGAPVEMTSILISVEMMNHLQSGSLARHGFD